MIAFSPVRLNGSYSLTIGIQDMVNKISEEHPLRLAILQRVCTGYRTALFRALSSEPRLEAMLYIGEDIPGSKVKNAADLTGINCKKLKTCFVKLEERILPWHKGLITELRKFNPDVILCEGESHFLGYIQALIYKYLFNNRVALIHWCFISLPGWSEVGGEGFRSVIKMIFRRCFDAFVVYSSYSKQCLLKLGQPREKIFVGTNVGSVEKFFKLSDSLIDSQPEARSRLGLPERFTVLYVGSLETVKRPHIMLDLAKMCDSEKYNFLLLGSGRLLEEIRERVIHENLSNVFVPGKVQEELPLYYRAANVLLIPGRGGIVISEAMSFGLPVIVHQADGTEYDLVKNGTTGIHLSAGNLNDFRNALEFLLSNPCLCAKMGLMGRQIIESHFKTNDLVQQIINAAYFARDHRNNLMSSMMSNENKNDRGYVGVIKSKGMRCLRLLRGYRHLKPSVFVNKKWYGNNYGGFFICPEFLNSNSIVYSFGIGEDISFDKAVIKSHNCQIFAFDPTPKSINWVKSQSLSSKFTFFEYGLGVKTGEINFFLPKNPEHVSGSFVLQSHVDENRSISVRMKSFLDIISDLKHERIDVLKMDIEGAEYEILESILESSIQINQILIEFHDRLLENGKSKTIEAIKKLNGYGYEIFGVSDSLEELSFINKRIR